MSDIARRRLDRKEDRLDWAMRLALPQSNQLTMGSLALQDVGELFHEGFKPNR
jgi:hypothetical protein